MANGCGLTQSTAVTAPKAHRRQSAVFKRRCSGMHCEHIDNTNIITLRVGIIDSPQVQPQFRGEFDICSLSWTE